MGTASRYDPHVEWYEAFRPAQSDEERDVLQRMLGPGQGRCLDIGCGTGVAIPELQRLGWDVVGVDVSAEMLGRARKLGAELHQADVASLPFEDASFDAAVSLWTHSDVDDFGALLSEAARVLEPGSPFVCLGVHPCFVGPHSRFFAAQGIPVLHEGYRRTERYDGGPSINPEGLRALVGAVHIPLGELIDAFLTTGFVLERFEEHGPNEYPHWLALGCRRAS